jgi:hypothetical protein
MEQFKPFHDVFLETEEMIDFLRAYARDHSNGLKALGVDITTITNLRFLLLNCLKNVKSQLHLCILSPSNLGQFIRNTGQKDWDELQEVLVQAKVLVEFFKQSETRLAVEEADAAAGGSNVAPISSNVRVKRETAAADRAKQEPPAKRRKRNI